MLNTDYPLPLATDGEEDEDIILSEPEVIVYGLDDSLLPGFHPPPPPGQLWPEVVAEKLNDVTKLVLYLTPPLLVFSTIGNIVAVIVLKRLYNGVLPTAAYVLMALFLDTLVLWMRCGQEWLKLVASVNLRELIVTSSLILCKIYPLISNTMIQLSSWLIVAMASETAWVHQHPQRLMKVCKTSRARCVIISLFLLAIVVNCSSLWTYSLYTSPSTSQKTSITSEEFKADESNGDFEEDHYSQEYSNNQHAEIDLADENYRSKRESPFSDEKENGSESEAMKERPTCANEITDERLIFASAAADFAENPTQINFYPSIDYRKALLLSADLLLSDFIPYFCIFSCAVMLVTKRLKRKDQVRQIDNTWKACNVDSTLAHQLHTCFITVAIAHTVLLFPKLVFKTFLLVTDPMITGLVPYPVEHRPCTVMAKTICYMLHYFFLSSKVFLLLASSNNFRSECLALMSCSVGCQSSSQTTMNSEDHTTTGLPLLQTNDNLALTETNMLQSEEIENKKYHKKENDENKSNKMKINNIYSDINKSKINETLVIKGRSEEVKSSKLGNFSKQKSTFPMTLPPNLIISSCKLVNSNISSGFPQPLQSFSYQYSTLNKTPRLNPLMVTSTLPLHPHPHPLPPQTKPLDSSTTSTNPKEEDSSVNMSATVIENGTPSIKIFSMTSV